MELAEGSARPDGFIFVPEFSRRGETHDAPEVFDVGNFWLRDSLVFAGDVLKQRGEGNDIDPVVIATQIAPDGDFVSRKRLSREHCVSPCESEPLFKLRRTAPSSAPHVFIDTAEEALSFRFAGHLPREIAQFLLCFPPTAESIGEQGELTLGTELVDQAGLVEILAQLLENLMRLRKSPECEERVTALAQEFATVVRRRYVAGESQDIFGSAFFSSNGDPPFPLLRLRLVVLKTHGADPAGV